MPVSDERVAIAKRMLELQIDQHVIAAAIGENSARVSEIKTLKGISTRLRERYRKIKPAADWALPQVGPKPSLEKRLESMIEAMRLEMRRELAAAANRHRQIAEEIRRLNKQLLETRRDFGLVETPQAPRPTRTKPMKG